MIPHLFASRLIAGRAVPDYEARVVDESGNDQSVDVPGQLLVRGPSVATGYWCRSDTTRATFEGEWMRTGDLYAVDADGFHTYLGRVDDMLRVAADGAALSVDDLIEHCRSRLAGYKQPKLYHMVDELPKTATGKIQRFKLRMP